MLVKRFAQMTLVAISMAMCLLLVGCATVSESSSEENSDYGSKYDSKYKYEGEFGYQTPFTLQTPNCHDVEYTIESIEAPRLHRLDVTIDWVAKKDGAHPDLSRLLTVFNHDGTALSVVHLSKNENITPEYGKKAKEGSGDSYDIHYSIDDSDDLDFEFLLSDEFGDSMASFEIQIDPETCEPKEDEADV